MFVSPTLRLDCGVKRFYRSSLSSSDPTQSGRRCGFGRRTQEDAQRLMKPGFGVGDRSEDANEVVSFFAPLKIPPDLGPGTLKDLNKLVSSGVHLPIA